MNIPVMIIPVLNRFDLLDKSLKSIDYPIDEILIINNSGNDDETKDIKENNPNLNIRILNLPSNMGISGSWNLGIKLYPHSKYWLISSADTSFLPGSLEKIAKNSDSDKLVKSNADYSCFSVGELIIEKIGLFDEFYYPAYYEDWDFNDRVVLAGLSDNMLFPQDIYVDDSGSQQTIKSNQHFANRNTETFSINGEYYYNKKNTQDYTVKGWDLKRRRENEWIKMDQLNNFYKNVGKPTEEKVKLFADTFIRHGSDKTGYHNYELIYSALFNDESKIKNVLEMGVLKGASLKSWKDIFLNAKIVGLEYDLENFFTEDRITSFYVDQTKEHTFDNFINFIEDRKFEFIVDDGSHLFEETKLTFTKLLPLLDINGWFVVEDIRLEFEQLWLDIAKNLPNNYEPYLVNLNHLAQTNGEDNIVLAVKKIK
jgi:GT2 family glycosyltransferase